MSRLLKYSGLLQKLFVSALIMVALAMSMDVSKLFSSLSEIHASAWIVATAFIFVQILALSYRWLTLINVYGNKISFGYAIKVNLASTLANYLFITSIGGIIARVAMSVKGGISLMRSIAATGLDRLFTLLGLVILTVLFLPVLSSILSQDIFHKTLGMILLCGLGAVLLSVIVFEAPRKKVIFSHRKVAMCFQYLRCVLVNQTVLGKVIGSSLVAQIAYFCAVYCVMTSMGIEFSWLHFMAIIPVITIVSSLPVGYGGWGIREGAFVYGLGLINVPLETAFSASVQIGLISMGAAIIAGIPVLFGGKSRPSFTIQKKTKDHA